MIAITANIVERCKQLGSSTLYEASGLPCSIDPDIRSIWPGAAIAAPAFPLVCSPGDNLSIHLALERAPRDSVLVVGTGNFVAGYWGEVLTVAAETAGIAGLVIDGGVRDVAAMTRRQFPVFTRGVSIRGTIKASSPSVGQSIYFGGITVNAGDLVVADDDGVIIIPTAEIKRTVAAAEVRVGKEEIMMKKLSQGATTLDLLGLSAWRTRS